MRPRDAAIAIAGDRNLSVEEIEQIILKAVEEDRTARQCCEYRARQERELWESVCKSETYWLAMTSQYCKEQGDPIGAERWIGAAAAIGQLSAKRAREVYR